MIKYTHIQCIESSVKNWIRKFLNFDIIPNLHTFYSEKHSFPATLTQTLISITDNQIKVSYWLSCFLTFLKTDQNLKQSHSVFMFFMFQLPVFKHVQFQHCIWQVCSLLLRNFSFYKCLVYSNNYIFDLPLFKGLFSTKWLGFLVFYCKVMVFTIAKVFV